MKTNEIVPERLLITAALLKRYDISDQTLRDWRRKFGFPNPNLVANRRVHSWQEAPVKEWERARTTINREAP